MNMYAYSPVVSGAEVLPSLLSSLGMIVVQISPERRIYEVEPRSARSSRLGEPLESYLDVVDKEQFQATLDWCRSHPGQPRRFYARVTSDPARTLRRGSISALVSGDLHTGYALTLLPANVEPAETQVQPEQLQHIDALSNTGLLAASVAHELATPLTQARLTLSVAQRRLADLNIDLNTLGMIDAVTSTVSDACYLTRKLTRLATVSKPQRLVPSDVHIVLDGVVALVSGDMRERALLVRDYERVPRVMANFSSLTHLLTNLLVNAMQAIPEGDPMAHMISVKMVHEGDEVHILVSDSGCGIAAEDLHRVFEPFYTTKRERGGTGLGLSVCRRILSELSGSISVRSELGKGSTFTITLPAVANDAP